MGEGKAMVADVAQTDAWERAPDSVARAPSAAGVRTPILTPGTGPGTGRIDFPFRVTPEVFLLE